MSGSDQNASSEWTPPTVEELHALLPQYEISAMLGRGGMGAVYVGRQARLDRDVAIKVLPETFTQGDDEMNFVARFEQEAQAMAKLDHPGIVSVHDFGETEAGQLYFVMELIDGMDIQQYLREHGGHLPQKDALAIVAHMLDALEYAHKFGIVHRDIKPANILLNREGRVKIADFGLAKTLSTGNEKDDAIPALTMTNMAVGTPEFVAPEALDSDQTPDHRADIYATGVMLYQMLTGTLPRGQFKLPSEHRPELDPRLDEIVSRSLQPHPSDRYASASEARLALDPIFSTPITRLEGGEKEVGEEAPVATLVTESNSQPVSLPRPKKAEISKAALYIGAGLVALLLLGGLVAYSIIGGTKKKGSEPGQLPEASSQTSASSGTPVTSATKDKPFVNSLGMKFVPLPINGGPTDGQRVLFSVWETRVADYRPFIEANQTREWPSADFPQDDDHPAVNVSWEDAVAFCEWLTEEDRKKGKIAKDQRYRLPTDHEWSCAAGIGKVEDSGQLPSAKTRGLAVFPWGRNWPPPKGAGNYYGEETIVNPFNNVRPIEGYEDPFDRSAPVGSFQPDEHGLYDLSGNVWEWSTDWYTSEQNRRVMRGGAWRTESDAMLLSHRHYGPDNLVRDSYSGFRCVLGR